MFLLESKWKELSPEERFKIRNTELKPILEDYLSWLQNLQPKVVKKSKLGQAINYSLSNWDLLTNIFTRWSMRVK